MREVKLCLYLLQPVLSGNKSDDPHGPHFTFTRNATGEYALILQEHWTKMMVFACKALSRATRNAYDIRFDPIVRGQIGIHHRFYDPSERNKYKRHEALLEGTIIQVYAVLPDSMRVTEFRELLEAGGKYCGITLHSWGDYGRFEAVSVE